MLKALVRLFFITKEFILENMTNTWAGYLSLAAFIIAYAMVIFEEKLHLRKSKPIVLVGCLMWGIIGLYEMSIGDGHAGKEVRHLIGDIGEIFFFVLVAMTYINALQDRFVFESLKSWLLSKKYGYRTLFWATGIITFFMAPVATSLPSALIMATVVSSIGKGNRSFIVPSFISIVVAANAGGVWSPFGDITTLMVWAAGKVAMTQFLYLVAPSLVNWIVPAVMLYFFIPKGRPEGNGERVQMKPGAKRIIVLGGLSIIMSILFYQFLRLPPVLGMMAGLGLLMFLGYFLDIKARRDATRESFNIFNKIEQVEFDTLFFFLGVIMSVGALQYIGYLAFMNTALYGNLGNTHAKVVIGLISAVVDNIPVMYAVLHMGRDMSVDQWLLVTFTTGVGGSLLSIGSAAGVAVMGVERNLYTFKAHLKWMPAIAIGYFLSLACWLLLAKWIF